MILRDVRSCYDTLSSKLSDGVRQLSFAGIAVIWMFRVGTDTGGIAFDPVLIWPLTALVGALAFDLAHYAYGSLAWSCFAHAEERKGLKDDDSVSPPEQINWPSLFFFWGKAVLCVTGYVLLLLFLKDKL